MRKILHFTFIIFNYSLFLLILPMLLFLISLNFSDQTFLGVLPWIYSPFLLLSPLITIGLGYKIVEDRFSLSNGLVPIVISLIGHSPFLWLYHLFNSVWAPADYFWLIGFPVLLGLIADFLSLTAPSFRQLRVRVKQ
jgi:hypothetical protein